jgi:hypothetical protein
MTQDAMRIGGTRESVFGQGGRSSRQPDSPTSSVSRALTVVEPPVRNELLFLRSDAAFLAHLIATKAQAPQTRAKRRAEPAEALAAYRAVAALR